MEDEVQRELETLRGMVQNWRDALLDVAHRGGGYGFLADELREDIESHVFPYVRRMFECAYLSAPEVRAFLEECEMVVEELRRVLTETEGRPLCEKEGTDA